MVTLLSPHPGEIGSCTLVALSSENDKRKINANKPGDGCPRRYASLNDRKNSNTVSNTIIDEPLPDQARFVRRGYF